MAVPQLTEITSWMSYYRNLMAVDSTNIAPSMEVTQACTEAYRTRLATLYRVRPYSPHGAALPNIGSDRYHLASHTYRRLTLQGAALTSSSFTGRIPLYYSSSRLDIPHALRARDTTHTPINRGPHLEKRDRSTPLSWIRRENS